MRVGEEGAGAGGAVPEAHRTIGGRKGRGRFSLREGQAATGGVAGAAAESAAAVRGEGEAAAAGPAAGVRRVSVPETEGGGPLLPIPALWTAWPVWVSVLPVARRWSAVVQPLTVSKNAPGSTPLQGKQDMARVPCLFASVAHC